MHIYVLFSVYTYIHTLRSFRGNNTDAKGHVDVKVIWFAPRSEPPIPRAQARGYEDPMAWKKTTKLHWKIALSVFTGAPWIYSCKRWWCLHASLSVCKCFITSSPHATAAVFSALWIYSCKRWCAALRVCLCTENVESSQNIRRSDRLSWQLQQRHRAQTTRLEASLWQHTCSELCQENWRDPRSAQDGGVSFHIPTACRLWKPMPSESGRRFHGSYR